MKSRLKVGIFDSGIGGLSVLKECVRVAPYAKYYYFGDNERAPYGNRSEEEILSFTREALFRFRKLKADAVVLACNTATAVAAGEMRREFSFPVIGTEPAIKPASEDCKRALVLATERTATSARIKMLLSRFQDCDFQVFACENLASAIEKYFLKGEPFLLSAHLPQGEFDGVVLGCTHYSLFSEEISKFYSVPVFDGKEGVAKRLDRVLRTLALGRTAHNLKVTKTNKRSRFFSKNTVKFIGKCRKLNKSVHKRTFVSKTTEKK